MSRHSTTITLGMVPAVVERHRFGIRPTPVLLPLQARPGGQLPGALPLDLVLLLVLLGVVLVGHRGHLLGEGHRLRAHPLVVDDYLGGQVIGGIFGRPFELAEGERRWGEGGGLEQTQTLENIVIILEIILTRLYLGQ